jgi:periplasmic protein TonB
VRATVHDRDAVTLTMKDSPELNGPGKPGAPSQNSENKSGQSPRSNPVCLEVGVTIRSLPNEANGQTQPIREEGRTVIVFDNGAVLRSTNQMPIGQTVILSNPHGRDVVCRVVGGRNLPSVKGYVEVEFLEPVNDFWGIHRDGNATAVAPPPAALPAPPREVPAPPPPPLRATAPLEASTKPPSVSLGSGPTFEDIPGLVGTSASSSTREPKIAPARPAPEKTTKVASDYNRSEVASPTSLANWNSTPAEVPAEKHAIAAMREALSTTSSAPTHDFLSKGLMAYEQPRTSSSGSNGRTPLIVGVAALALAGVGGVVFVMHRNAAPAPVSKAAVVSKPSIPEPPAAKTAPEPVETTPEAAAPTPTPTPTQASAQPVAVEQAQPVAAASPVPAVVTTPATSDSRPESKNVRRPEKNAVAAKQPDLPSPRRPVIPNLKIGSPSAPNRNLANPSDGPTPMTDIASTEAVGGVPAASLLTSAGRTSNPPAPPPSALAPPVPAPVAAPKIASSPRMISSTRPVYPEAARQSNIHGIVTVSANVDANGKVVSAKALSGPFLLQAAAVDAVKQWKYSPSMLDGKPVPSQVTVSVEFRIN